MAREATLGLKWRKEYGRGGTQVGVARANQLRRRDTLSFETVKRMKAYFDRHEVDMRVPKNKNPKHKDYPGAGKIAWLLWGGDSGRSFANRIVRRLNSIDERSDEMELEERHIKQVTETEDSFIIEFGKSEEKEEVIEEIETQAMDEEEKSYGEEEEREEDEEEEEEREEDEERSFLNNEITYRTFLLDRQEIDEDTRTVQLAFSSEEPVQRSFGTEVLSHGGESVRLGRLNNKAPLLINHQQEPVIGVVERATIDSDKVGRAIVRFGRSAMADEIFQDVKDGIRNQVSVGYRIHKMEKDSETDDALYRAVDWEPYEVSMVSIAADQSVGVGRSAETIPVTNSTIERKPKMEVQEKALDVNEVRKSEVNRIREIESIGAELNKQEMARQFINEGRSVEEFSKEVLKTLKQVEVKPDNIDMTSKEVRSYSMLRAVEASLSGDWSKAGLELEASQAVAQKTGKENRGGNRGFYLPNDIRIQKRDLTVGTATAGGNLVGTDHLGAQFVDALRARMVTRELGAQTLSGLQGDIQIPALNAKTTVYWVAENAAPTEGAPTFRQISMSPKSVSSYIDVSRKLMAQSDPSVEQVVRNDVLDQLAQAVDTVALNGGGSNEPTGILQTTGVGDVAIATNGGAITWAKTVDVFGTQDTANALTGNLAWCTTPSVRAEMMTIERASNTAQFIVNDPNELMGYRMIASTNVPSTLTKGTTSGSCHALIFGNWSELFIGEWGSLDVLVDPYSNSTTGATRLSFFYDVDVMVRHAESFTAIQDITVS